MTDKIAWLAGFFDGEGSIELAMKISKKHPEVQLRCELANTNFYTIDYTVGLLNMLGVTTKVYIRNKNHLTRKPAKRIMISGYSNVIKFVGILYPYLVTKKPQANLILKYHKTHIYRSRPTEVDIGIARELRKVNTRGNIINNSDPLVNRNV